MEMRVIYLRASEVSYIKPRTHTTPLICANDTLVIIFLQKKMCRPIMVCRDKMLHIAENIEFENCIASGKKQ